jgi:hypothetical protein
MLVVLKGVLYFFILSGLNMNLTIVRKVAVDFFVFVIFIYELVNQVYLAEQGNLNPS